MSVIDLQRIAVSLIGAVALSTACFAGAALPADASAATVHAAATLRAAPVATGLVGAVRY